MARSCLFCGSRKKLTKEHVYPAWLYRALNIGGPITFMYGDETVRITPRLDTTLREVCGACNNGWLHDLEHTFRSVMLNALQGHSGEPTVLNPGAQQDVASAGACDRAPPRHGDRVAGHALDPTARQRSLGPVTGLYRSRADH